MKAQTDNFHPDSFPTEAEGRVSTKISRDVSEARVHRRIGLHHIAFLRGYFEGLDVAILADQYLALGRDKKRGLAAKRWIVEELVSAARKRGDAVGARLLRLPAGALPELEGGTSAAAVDLEVFREQVDPDGVYSESELVELLKASLSDSDPAPVPQARRAQRNTRLRHRQRALLERLEHALAEPPRAHHPIRDWLDAALAARLASAGLITLSELADFITLRGYRWYRHIPRVGEQAAIRILHWMERNAADLGLSLPDQSRLPRKAWSVALTERVAAQSAAPLGGIAAIEYFAPRCPTAKADRDILLQWLQTCQSCPSTYRAYRSQAERLLLWITLERGIGLAAMTTADVSAYFAFITRADLPSAWCGPKAERHTAAWRPIEKCPSKSSISVARRILKLAFDYLCSHGYCAENPLILTRDILTQGESTQGESTQGEATPSKIAHGIAFNSAAQGGSEIVEPAEQTKTSDIDYMDSLIERHPADRVVAFAREQAVHCGVLSAAQVSMPGALRHLRLAVVHTLLNATAWPLSTLVQLRVEHLLSAVSDYETVAGAALSFHDGRRLRQAHLNRNDLCLIDEYFRLRAALTAGQLSDNPFLIGRHVDEAPKGALFSITPNVLSRALRQYHRTHWQKITASPDESNQDEGRASQTPPSFTMLHAFKRRARQQRHALRPWPIHPDHFVKPCWSADLRAFTSLNSSQNP